MPTADTDRTSTCIGTIVDAVFAPVASRTPLVYIVRDDGTLALWPPSAPVMPAFALRALATAVSRDATDARCTVVENGTTIVVYRLRSGLRSGGHAVVIET
jgi:hypothetical protein